MIQTTESKSTMRIPSRLGVPSAEPGLASRPEACSTESRCDDVVDAEHDLKRVYDSVVFDAKEETPGYSELRKVENAGLVFSRPSARALSFRGFQ